jgi:WD40 repeat protein
MKEAGENAPAPAQPLASWLRGWLADASGKLFGSSSGRAELPRRNNGTGKARASLAGDRGGARDQRLDNPPYGFSAGFGAQAPPCLPHPQCFGAFCLPDAQVMCMAVLLDGRIACGCDDGTILLVHVNTRSQRSSPPLDAHRGSDRSQPEEGLAHRDGVHSTGNCHAGISQTLNLHTAGVTSLCILPSNGHCRMASASWDGTVRVWDVSLLGSSPCVSVLRLSGADDVNARECARYGIRNADGATCLALDEGRGFLWAGSSSGLLKIWDVVDGTEVCVVQKAHDRAVSCALYLDPSDALATAGADCMIRIWSAASQQCLVTLMGHTGPVESLGLCPHSMRLFSSSSCDSTVRSWALEEDEGGIEEGEQEQARRKREDVEKEGGVSGGVGPQAVGLDHEPWLGGDEDGGGVREERKRGKTCGPMSTLAAHILDPTNPTSTGYVTAGQQQGTKLTNLTKPAQLNQHICW